MSDFHFHFHLSETPIMSALNEILARIETSEAKADAERTQVVEAVNALKYEISLLREQVASGTVDPATVSEALDRLDAKIDGIYEPEAPAEPPAE